MYSSQAVFWVKRCLVVAAKKPCACLLSSLKHPIVTFLQLFFMQLTEQRMEQNVENVERLVNTKTDTKYNKLYAAFITKHDLHIGAEYPAFECPRTHPA